MLTHSIKNIFRNKRRSLMIIFILFFSISVMFLTNSYLEGMYWALKYGAKSSSGFIQVVSKGYWDNKDDEKKLINISELERIEEYISNNNKIVSFNKELSFQGLLGDSRNSTVISGVGVETGKYNGALSSASIIDGRTLLKNDEVIIAKGVNSRLSSDDGDWLTYLGQTIRGSFNPVNLNVVGVMTTGIEETDKYFAATTLETAQNLLLTDKIERVLLFMSSDAEDSVIIEENEKINEYFKKHNLELETRTWSELSMFYYDLKKFYDMIFRFVIIIIIALVFLSTTEIVSMTFFERFREIGTLRSIGTTKMQIFTLLILEIMALFILGLGSGVGITVFVEKIINNLQLQWIPPGSSQAVPFYFFIKLKYAILPGIITFLAALFATVLPALKASRLNVVEVLNYD